MVVDRFKEFTTQASLSHALSPPSSLLTPPVSPDSSKVQGVVDPDELLFTRIAEIRGWLRELESSLKRIESLHRQALTSVSEQATLRLNEEAKVSTQRTNSLFMSTQTAIKELGSNITNSRLGTAQAAVLGKRLLELLHQWESQQNMFRKKYQSQLERQYLIINPAANREELDRIIQGGEVDIMSSQQHQLFLPGGKAQAEQRLKEMKDRQVEIQRIERSIQELHQMFVDVSIMVDQQGAVVDNLQSYVALTYEHTEKAAIVMQTSVAQKKAALRRKWILILIVICIILVTILIVYISHKMDQKPVVVQPTPPTPQPQQQPNKPPQNTPAKPPIRPLPPPRQN